MAELQTTSPDANESSGPVVSPYEPNVLEAAPLTPEDRDRVIAESARDLSVGLLGRMGLSVSGASGPAKVVYIREKSEHPKRPGEIVETAEFIVFPGDQNRPTSVQYQARYQDSPDHRLGTDQLVDRIAADIDTSEEDGGVAGEIEVQELPVADKAPWNTEYEPRPRPEGPDVRLHRMLLGLRSDPGEVSVSFGPIAPVNTKA